MAHCGVKFNFDHSPTRDLVDVDFKPMAPGSKHSVHKTYPDTGCKQSMIFADLINSVGFKVKNVKTVEAVDGGKVQYLGSVATRINYQSLTAHARMLVDEVILSKTVLADLGIIDLSFPYVLPRGRTIRPVLKAVLGGVPGARPLLESIT